ncbi:MAG: T9SS type A sorting domain-containing protein, partial [Bacteroidota bacterium]
RTISRNAGIYNDSLLIFCGKTRQGENAVVSGLRRDTLVYEWEKELDVRGTALKWVQGEKEEIIYLLVQDQDFTIKLLKFDVQQQDLVWEKIVNRQATQTILASGIAFNPQDQSISIIGNYSYNEGRHDGNFIKFFDTEGNVFFEKIDEGNYKGKTQAIAIFSFPNAPVTLIGGSRTQHSIQHDAFLSFYNVNFVSESTPLNIFYDNNENGIKDENDNNISIGNFTIDESLTAYPNFNGIYLIPPDSNSELVEYNLPVNWKLTTDSLQYHLTSNNTSMGVDTLFFGIAPLVKVNETETFIISDPTICNEVSEVRLFVKNTGTETVNILASFETRDSILSYSILTDSIVNNKSYWTFNEVGPNEFRIIDMSLQIAGVEAIGEDVVFQSTATSSTSDDEEKQISSFIYREVLLCAYDPNDKLVQPKGMGKDNRTPFGETFNYTIRFQNTGNFPARNIILKDTLDGHLNLKTFEVIHASHDITSIVIENRVLTFTFNDINLPDSTNNEPLSHGYVNFKITPLDGLGENTLIENSAAIYFDQNPAIITNTTKNTLASDITTSTEEQKEQYQLILYPNPTTGILNIEADPPLSYPSHWKVYNQLGQVVKEGKALSNQIDLSDLQNGWYVFQIAGEITRKVMILR